MEAAKKGRRIGEEEIDAKENGEKDEVEDAKKVGVEFSIEIWDRKYNDKKINERGKFSNPKSQKKWMKNIATSSRK